MDGLTLLGSSFSLSASGLLGSDSSSELELSHAPGVFGIASSESFRTWVVRFGRTIFSCGYG